MVCAGFVGVCVAHSARHMRWMSMCVCVCVWYVKPGRGALSQLADITNREHPALPTQRVCTCTVVCVFVTDSEASSEHDGNCKDTNRELGKVRLIYSGYVYFLFLEQTEIGMST